MKPERFEYLSTRASPDKYEVDELVKELKKCHEVLGKCANKFREYANHHKGKLDTKHNNEKNLKKIEHYKEMAKSCEALIKECEALIKE